MTLFDARSADADVGRDPRTLARSLGSVQLLERLQAWDASRAQPIHEAHVSQQPPSWGPLGEPELRIRAIDEGVPMLGAVLSYGQIVAPLQAAWFAACEREPGRPRSRFGTPVAALAGRRERVEIDAGIAETFDLAVVAEGRRLCRAGAQGGNARLPPDGLVGQVTIEGGTPGTAFERFTRQGPAALLPLRSEAGAPAHRAALVWCVARDDDRSPRSTTRSAWPCCRASSRAPGRLTAVTPLKSFALGLNAEAHARRRRTVRIGNAAQTLHPVAGQGLNLGLRDAVELVRALATGADIDDDAAPARVEARPDRWGMIAATDFLARSFTWDLPGLSSARGIGLAALQLLGPVRSALARQMMFGSR